VTDAITTSYRHIIQNMASLGQSSQHAIPSLFFIALVLSLAALLLFQQDLLPHRFVPEITITRNTIIESAYKFIGNSKPSSSKPRAILHIGPHKVASSYIQAKLCEERDLLESIGFTVPIAKTCEKCQAKHFAGVAAQLRGSMPKAEKFGCSPDPVADLKEALKSTNGSIILSSEGFDLLGDDAVGELADILSDYKTTIVMYYRLKLEHIVSYFTQIQRSRNSPMSFLDFIWKIVSSIDPDAGPNDPVTGLNGLCYKRLFESYGRHFGEENLSIIYYNGLKDADLDPWEVLMKEVLSYKEYTLPEQGVQRKNVSPNPFHLSMAAHYYKLTWARSSSLSSSEANAEEGVGAAMPYLDCIIPLLEPLEDVLPKKCSNLRSMCALWELQEQEYLNQLSKGKSRLLHFELDSDGEVVFQDKNYTVCEIDEGRLQEGYNKEQYYSTMEKVTDQIKIQCGRG
jgi:hypothetical protein